MDQVWGALKGFLTFLASLTREDISIAVHQIFWVLVLLSVIQTLRKLPTIREIIREFNKARGPIWDLRETIAQLTKLEPVIRDLGEQMQLLYAKVEAAQRQVAELQAESVSGRIDDGDSVRPDIGAVPINIEGGEVEDPNWELLRSYWRRNTARIEYVIEGIEDGRSRIAYDRMPRTNYTRIVDKLENAGLITLGAANASRELFDLFNKYRPKNRKVPDSVVGVVGLLDKQLDNELVKFQDVEASEDDIPIRPPAPNQVEPSHSDDRAPQAP